MLKYAIGKKTRYQPLEVVSVQPQGPGDGECARLRNTLFDNIGEAWEAAIQASKICNPVGFTVVIVTTLDNT